MAERYFGHAPRGLKAAAVERYLTSDLMLEEVGAQNDSEQYFALGES